MDRRLLLGLLTGVGALVLVAAVGCGDDDDDGGTATATASPTPSESAGTPSAAPTATDGATPTEEPFSGARDPVEKSDPMAPPVALQTDVRYAAHSDYDRVVFDFTDNAPGYVIMYVDPPILADGSGNEVEVEGAAFLQVRFSTAQAHDDAGNSTVAEMEIMPGLDSIVEIQQTGDFEGYVTWVLGLPEELDFRVIDLEDPTRVAVDIGHP